MARNTSILLLLVISSVAGMPGPLRKTLDITSKLGNPMNDAFTDQMAESHTEVEMVWANSLKAELSMSMMPVGKPSVSRPPTRPPSKKGTPLPTLKTKAPNVIIVATLTPSLSPLASSAPVAPLQPPFNSPVSSPTMPTAVDPLPVPVTSPAMIAPPANSVAPVVQPVAITPSKSIPNIQPSLKGPTVEHQDKVPTQTPVLKKSKGLSAGEIAAIVIGSMAAVCAAAAVVWKYKKDSQSNLVQV